MLFCTVKESKVLKLKEYNLIPVPGFKNRFTDVGSNDPGSNAIRSNDKWPKSNKGLENDKQSMTNGQISFRLFWVILNYLSVH